MNELKNDAHIDVLYAEERTKNTTSTNLAKRGFQPLSAQEISVVAGGPESEVGNGVSPPH